MFRPAGDRLTCRDMVNGLLAELEDYNCWTLAGAAGHPSPCRMQHLLSRARCDEQLLLDSAAGWAAAYLTAGQDQSDVVLIVDETADAKSSAARAGAARQYSGTLGGASRRRDLYRRQQPVELSVTDRRMLVFGRKFG